MFWQMAGWLNHFFKQLRTRDVNKYEKVVFFILFLINLIPLFSFRFAPSLDGPQHLCTSEVIVELWKSNGLISNFFSLNPEIVGNWTGHFVLSVFNFFLPAWLAEKCLIFLYYLGIALGFRYMLKSWVPRLSLLSLLIIPFSSTTLLMLGYYNFCLATIFFFFAFGYWKRHENRPSLIRMLVFSALLVLLFLSHTFVYTLFGFTLAVFIFTRCIVEILKINDKKALLKTTLRKGLFVLIAAIPSIILWYRYLQLTTALTPYKKIATMSAGQLADRLYRLEMLIGFHHIREAAPNTILLYTLIILTIFSAFSGISRFRNKSADTPIDFILDRLAFFIATSALLLLYFVFPNEIISGNVSTRIAIIFFFAFIVWINLIRLPGWLVFTGAIAIAVATVWHRALIFEFHDIQNAEIAELLEVEAYIEPNTIILPRTYSANWMHNHYTCYVGSDMPVVNLANPQCTGQFPVVWNYERYPDVFFGGKSMNFSGNKLKITNPGQRPIVFVDYVVIWGKQLFDNDTQSAKLKEVLNKYFELTYVSSNKKAMLFRFKAGARIKEIAAGIYNKKSWIEEVRDKAEKRGIPVEKMVMLDAIYMYNKYY